MPQLGTILSSSLAGPQASGAQHTARVVAHPGAGSLSQVRVLSAQAGLTASPGGTLMHPTTHQIRLPVTMGAKGITQVSTPMGVAVDSSLVSWIILFFI